MVKQINAKRRSRTTLFAGRALSTGVVVLLLGIRSAFAQDLGFPPYGSFEDGKFDAVNRQNLNVHFSIPIVAVPGRGMDFTASLAFDSLIWKKVGTTWAPVGFGDTGTPTLGWKLQTPGGRTTFISEMVECGTKPYISQHHYGYVFTDPSGTTHAFGLNFFGNPCGGPTQPRTGYALDNSGYYIDATGPGNPTVWAQDGTKYSYNGTITDTNGNYISKTEVPPNETDWIDTVGRTALKIIRSTSYTDYQFQDTTGAYQTVRLNYVSMPVATKFQCPGMTDVTLGGNYNFPSSVVMPNGQTYAFTYEATPGAIGYTTGRLLRLTLPTGGYYDYSYLGSNMGVICSDGSISAIMRTVNDASASAVWVFARTPLSGGAWETDVTAPQLPYDSAPNVSVFKFDSSKRETQRKFFQGSDISFATPLAIVDTTYSGGNRTPITQTTTLADGRMARVTTSYDSYGLPLQVTETNWGQGAVGSTLRVTNLTYLRLSQYTSRQINNRLTSVVVRDNIPAVGLVDVYRRNVGYDGATPTCLSGVTHHDDTLYGCTFNIRGNLTSTTEYADPVALTGAVTNSVTFDTLGNQLTANADCCRFKSWSYSPANAYAYPVMETSGAVGGPQLTTSVGYDPSTGLFVSMTDANNRTTSVSYDSMKRVTSRTRPDGAQTTFTYTDTSPSSVAVKVPVDATNWRRSSTLFDGLGRPVRETLTDGTGGTTYSIVDRVYDALGRSYRSSNPYLGSPSYWDETRYDALSRPTLIIPPDGNPTTNNVSMSYVGVTQTQTDQAGHQRRFDYDPPGRLVKVTEPDPVSGALTVDTVLDYDGRDQLKKSTQGTQIRTFAHDGLGRLTSRGTPEGGTDTYQYNSFGLVTQRTDARGVITSYDYDTLNRPTQITYNVGTTGVPATATVGYTYGTSAASNNNGRLITFTDGTGQTSYSYDISGRISQMSKTISGVSYPITYGYNYSDEITSIGYPSGRQVLQSFDGIGRRSSIQFNGAAVLSGFTYNIAQQVTAFSFGNGVAASLSFTPTRLQLATLAYTKSGVSLPSLAYGYAQPNGGNNGEVTQVTDNTSSGRSVTYTYDLLDRLATAESTGSASYPKWKLGWSYDQFGNRLSQSALIGSPPTNTVSVNTSTNRISTAGYTYDAAGNMTAKPGATLTPDAEGRTVTYSGGSSTYAYDGYGFRVRRTTGGVSTVYVYSGSKVIAEYAAGSAASSPQREYIYSGTMLVATYDGSMKYHHSDHLSMRATTNATGSLDSETGHFPFGESWYATGGGTKKLFTTYDRDAESGLDYAVARYMNPVTGRFNSPDLFAGTIRMPQSLNRYAYVANNPINATDPLGLMAVCTESYHWDGHGWVPDGGSCIDELPLRGGWPPPGDPGVRPPGGPGSGGGRGGSNFPFLTKQLLCDFLKLYTGSLSNREHNWERGGAISPDGKGDFKVDQTGWTTDKTGHATGPVGPNDLGSVHTHPSASGWSQEPSTTGPGSPGSWSSQGDWGASKQTGKPTFVLSKDGLWVITKDPLGKGTNPAHIKSWGDMPKAKDCN